MDLVEKGYINVYYMACVCRRYDARSDWLIVTELWGKEFSVLCPLPKQVSLLAGYNKQLNNLDHPLVTGRSQTSAYRIDLAIARSIRQGLSLRFSRNLGY